MKNSDDIKWTNYIDLENLKIQFRELGTEQFLQNLGLNSTLFHPVEAQSVRAHVT